eukprot:TRINITY_DN51686_c0_g1_i1.p1 TRINITY_DN51686_c0_g1~~TRINITY_DN51686_c0_g1_i1.p1  ORF type:complete len:335 (+),score=50.13 TRINITY_DN51686_c0_g1_i1:84-1007(+)
MATPPRALLVGLLILTFTGRIQGSGPPFIPRSAPKRNPLKWNTGKTTRYWDCCKPSCAWPDKFEAISPVRVCAADSSLHSQGTNVENACGGGGVKDTVQGPGYSCPNQQPFFDFATNNSFLFAAAAIIGQTEKEMCCACFELVFLRQTRAGRVFVQVTNTGGDLGENHFDLQIPGGGFGIFDACTGTSTRHPAQFPKSPTEAWGSRYGGLLAAGGKTASACQRIPEAVRAGCIWFYNYMEALDNPKVHFARVRCPKQLTEVSGCRRSDDVEAPLPMGAARSLSPSGTLQRLLTFGAVFMAGFGFYRE